MQKQKGQRNPAAVLCAVLFLLTSGCGRTESSVQPFQLMETTIADVHEAYQSGKLTARQLTQMSGSHRSLRPAGAEDQQHHHH